MRKHMPPPFPQALHGKKEIKNSSEILEVLRQVKVNIPDATHGSLALKEDVNVLERFKLL